MYCGLVGILCLFVVFSSDLLICGLFCCSFGCLGCLLCMLVVDWLIMLLRV